MARPKASANGESKSRVFARLYESRKDLLKVPSSNEILEMYKAEDSSRSVGTSERQVAANVKSKLRKKYKLRGRRRGRKARIAAAAGGGAAIALAPRTIGTLLALEDSIDDCLYLAKKTDPQGLEDIIRHLRRARNLLIVRNGAR